MRKIILLLSVILAVSANAQMPHQMSSSEIYHHLKKLNVLGNVLYVAAHPDDENQRFITYCANEKLFNASYLSLTRGDGGQNLIGTEIREELGIIRTQELLAARRTDGGKQYFSRANDFGYSKTPEETLEIWDKDKILADVVWTIRKTRPDVIVTRFPVDGGGGHGHHTASAMLTVEAFDLAGDKTVYPEQLKYVDVWQPKRVTVNTGRWWNDTISDNDPGVVTIDIGKYNTILGTSYNELAAKSRSMHKCQGFGATGSRGEKIEYFEHLIGDAANDDLFEGYKSDWSRVDGSAIIQKLVLETIETYDIDNPSKSIPILLNLRGEVERLSDKFWKQKKLAEIDKLLIQCAGLYIEAVADEFSKTSGDSLTVNFECINRSSFPIVVKNISSEQLDYSKEINMNLASNDIKEFDVDFVVPQLPLSQPYWLAKEGSLGTFLVEEQELIGTPENGHSVEFGVLLEMDGEEIHLPYPLIYKWNNPADGETYRPFIIGPKVTANLNQPIYLFSDLKAQQVDLMLKAGSKDQSGSVEIVVPQGWEVQYSNTFKLEKQDDEIKIQARLKPNQDAVNGELKVLINGKPAKSLNTIAYDHIPTQTWFPEAKSKLVYIDIKKTIHKIGYIEGAGDVVPDALRNIGYEVDMLTEEDLDPQNLEKYESIIVGIRYFNVNERSPFTAPKLMQYVENGGNLVIQYNTRHRMKTQDFGPYPIKLSRERVTEEDAAVTILKPNHAVLNYPNKITKADFDGWVQERGLYFPSEWDEKYETILSWHDKDEDAKEGSLLVTQYGKGHYTYTGISFFRELPAAVPGAYRLLVNLISQGSETK